MKYKCLFAAVAFAISAMSVSAQTSQDYTIEGSVGKLAATLQLPKINVGEKCPVVIICHGFGSNMNSPILVQLANDLQQSGIAALRFDFNGCGKSEGLFQNMTVVNEIEDLKRVIDWVEKQPFTENVSLAGHSQGGIVASMTAGELGYTKIKSLALMAAAAVLRDDALRGQLQGAKYNPHDVPETFTIPGRGLTVGRNYVLTAQVLPIYETALQYTGPVFIIHGTYDVIVPYTYAERFHAGYKNSKLSLVDGEDHSFTKFTVEDAQQVDDFFISVLKNGDFK